MPAIDGIFDDLVKRGGSDLHLAVNQPPLARVRGEILALRESPVTAKELEDMLVVMRGKIDKKMGSGKGMGLW